MLKKPSGLNGLVDNNIVNAGPTTSTDSEMGFFETSTPPGIPRFAVCMDEKEDRKNKPILHPKTELNIRGRSFPKLLF